MVEITERGFRLFFENGYGISVLKFERAYCSENTAEIAILKGETLSYSQLIDPSVIDEKWGYQVNGWVTADEIASYINKVKSIER